MEVRVNGMRASRWEPTANEVSHVGMVNLVQGSEANYAAPGVRGVTIAGGGAVSYFGFGETNSVTADFGTVGGGGANASSGGYATVSGGERNTSSGWYAAVGGGVGNLSSGTRATVGGGSGNQSAATSATVGGGFGNRSTGEDATIGGGNGNVSSATGSTVGGGNGNTSSSAYATVGGGSENTSSGLYSAVPGGSRNEAKGAYSLAAGTRAQANHYGSFVWSDPQGTDFSSSGDNQFSIRASGGVRLNEDTSLFFGQGTRQMINLWGTEYGLGVQTDTLYARSFNDFSWFRQGTHAGERNAPGAGGTELMRLTTAGLTVKGTFVSSSDRNAKQNLQAVDPQAVLEKVAALPISRWSYKADVAATHLGPMAQDFHAAFGLGSDDRHIATVDADGVALAAIQGLNRKLEEALRAKEGEITELRRALDSLQSKLAQLEARSR
jgi:hypothetical protein